MSHTEITNNRNDRTVRINDKSISSKQSPFTKVNECTSAVEDKGFLCLQISNNTPLHKQEQHIWTEDTSASSYTKVSAHSASVKSTCTYWTCPTWEWTQRCEAHHFPVLSALGCLCNTSEINGWRRIAPFPEPSLTQILWRVLLSDRANVSGSEQSAVSDTCSFLYAAKCTANAQLTTESWASCSSTQCQSLTWVYFLVTCHFNFHSDCSDNSEDNLPNCRQILKSCQNHFKLTTKEETSL